MVHIYVRWNQYKLGAFVSATTAIMLATNVL